MRSLFIIHTLPSVAFKPNICNAGKMPLAELTQLLLLRFARLADASWPNDSGRASVQT
jgi:hypothetical protein